MVVKLDGYQRCSILQAQFVGLKSWLIVVLFVLNKSRIIMHLNCINNWVNFGVSNRIRSYSIEIKFRFSNNQTLRQEISNQKCFASLINLESKKKIFILNSRGILTSYVNLKSREKIYKGRVSLVRLNILAPFVFSFFL